MDLVPNAKQRRLLFLSFGLFVPSLLAEFKETNLAAAACFEDGRCGGG